MIQAEGVNWACVVVRDGGRDGKTVRTSSSTSVCVEA